MAKVIIAGDAVVINSSIKFEDLKAIKKYRPEALILKGGEDGKEQLFKIGIGENCGGISKYGITFATATRDDEKLATLTVVDNFDGEDASSIKEKVADKFGETLTNLNALEANLPDVIDEIETAKNDIIENITVAQ